MRSLISILHVLAIYSILRAVISQASICDLKKMDIYLAGYENKMYLGMKENDLVKYRGKEIKRSIAVDQGFTMIKEKICPILPPKF